MSILTKQMKKAIRKVQKELRHDISYVTLVSLTTAACTACSNETMTGMPYDSFCETCAGKSYTETENERVIDATISIADGRSEHSTYLLSGKWEPGMAQVIADKTDSTNPVTGKTYFGESQYLTFGKESDKYKVVVVSPGSFGLTVSIMAKKIS